MIFSFQPLLHWPSLNKTQASGSALIQALWSAILTVLRRRLKPRVGYLNPWGNADPTCSLANFGGTGGSGCLGDTSAVGAYPAGASPFGALDMAGNVQEWVNDWYDASYYASSPASNPQGPSSGAFRVLRGGSWFDFGNVLRSADRSSDVPNDTLRFIGFRCAHDP